jgi:hypothetical protein
MRQYILGEYTIISKFIELRTIMKYPLIFIASYFDPSRLLIGNTTIFVYVSLTMQIMIKNNNRFFIAILQDHQKAALQLRS